MIVMCHCLYSKLCCICCSALCPYNFQPSIGYLADYRDTDAKVSQPNVHTALSLALLSLKVLLFVCNFQASFVQSLMNHMFFTISSIILVILFLMGIHKRVVTPSMYPFNCVSGSVLDSFKVTKCWCKALKRMPPILAVLDVEILHFATVHYDTFAVARHQVIKDHMISRLVRLACMCGACVLARA